MPDDAVGMPVATDRGLLRFLTCGSVDDGKSTLIGRLLFNAELVLADQLEALERESRRFGTTGGDIDSRFCSMGSKTSASNASRSTSLTVFLRRHGAPLSSPIRQGTSNTPATWSPAPRPPIWRCCWSMPAKGY